MQEQQPPNVSKSNYTEESMWLPAFSTWLWLWTMSGEKVRFKFLQIYFWSIYSEDYILKYMCLQKWIWIQTGSCSPIDMYIKWAYRFPRDKKMVNWSFLNVLFKVTYCFIFRQGVFWKICVLEVNELPTSLGIQYDYFLGKWKTYNSYIQNN